MKDDLREIRAGALQDAGREFFGLSVLDQDVDPLARHQQADDFGIDPRDGLELAGPIFTVVRPGKPGGLVRLPLGGHAVAELSRRTCGLLDRHFVLAQLVMPSKFLPRPTGRR